MKKRMLFLAIVAMLGVSLSSCAVVDGSSAPIVGEKGDKGDTGETGPQGPVHKVKLVQQVLLVLKEIKETKVMMVILHGVTPLLVQLMEVM